MCAIGFCIVSLQRMSNNRISAVSCQDIFESQKQGLTDITSYKRVWILHQTLAVLADIIQASHTFLLPVQVNTQTHSHTHWKSSEGVLCHAVLFDGLPDDDEEDDEHECHHHGQHAHPLPTFPLHRGNMSQRSC